MVAIRPAGKSGRKKPPKKRTQIKRKIVLKSSWTKLPVAGPGPKAKGARREKVQKR